MSATNKSFSLWPYAIIGFFVVFIGVTIGLVAVANASRTDLVAGDYYEQELRYQKHIDRVKRTAGLATTTAIRFDPAANLLRISLPPEHALPQPTGRIHLYRPSAAGLDQEVPLATDPRGAQNLDAQKLAPGLWKVRIDWTAGGQDYYAEQDVLIPRVPAATAPSPVR